MTPTAAQALVPFGFTALEAEIYAFLLAESPATGYRVAQAIAKPAANVYKAIQTLELKDAVEVETGDARAVRAVPYEELLERLEREAALRRKAAREAFARVAPPKAGGERVLPLRSADAALARARELIAGARREILGAVGTEPFDLLADDLDDARARGVEVVLLLAADSDAGEIETFPGADEGELRLCADGEAFLCIGEVGAGYWTTAPALATSGRRGLASELTAAALRAKATEDGVGKRWTKILDRFRL